MEKRFESPKYDKKYLRSILALSQRKAIVYYVEQGQYNLNFKAKRRGGAQNLNIKTAELQGKDVSITALVKFNSE